MNYKVGEVIFKDEEIILNEGKPTVEVVVDNTGDRTIQVCSHYHFFEANRALDFDREKSYGMRLDIPSGNAIRFEPGEQKKVTLIPFGGDRKIIGFAGLVMGNADDPEVKKNALANLDEFLKGGK